MLFDRIPLPRWLTLVIAGVIGIGAATIALKESGEAIQWFYNLQLSIHPRAHSWWQSSPWGSTLVVGGAVGLAAAVLFGAVWWSWASKPPIVTASLAVLRVMGTSEIEFPPGSNRKGIKIEMLLDNETMPDAELQNVSAQVWVERRFFLGIFKQSQQAHPWEEDRDRRRYRIWVPVLPKKSLRWLPPLVFALPPSGERAIFGGEIVSKTTEFRQYRWALINEGGKHVLSGGDATPELL